MRKLALALVIVVLASIAVRLLSVGGSPAASQSGVRDAAESAAMDVAAPLTDDPVVSGAHSTRDVAPLDGAAADIAYATRADVVSAIGTAWRARSA